MKRLIRGLSVYSFLIYLAAWLFNLVFWNLKPGSQALFGLFPLVYPIFCFCTTFAKCRNPALFAAGFLVHIFLAVWVVMNRYASAYCVLFALATYFALAWFWMYSKLENQTSV